MAKSKPWKKPVKGRAPEGSRQRRRVLICCEDSKSSADYLRRFQIDQQRVDLQVVGTGMNTDSLVQAAIEFVEKARKNKNPYSQTWCVFDRDSFPLENYARAFQLARAHNIETAWTNEAFEFWYLLHFNYFDSAISRSQYARKLSERGLEYDKADRNVYEKVKAKQETAIRNAKRLERHWNESGSKFPERENPSTNVHELVEFLNELADLGKVG
jgi:hypothetical protein